MQPSTEAEPPKTMQEKWVAWRNDLLASPKFRGWAMRFCATRPVARQRAAAMFDINAGFIYSQIAFALVETRTIGLLAGGARTIDDVALAADLPEDGAERMLKAGAALELTERLRDGRYVLGPLGAALHGNSGVAEMIQHHQHLYADLADPVGLLRRGGGGGALAKYWAYARKDDPIANDDAAVGAYSGLMAASQTMVAEQVVAAYDFGRHKRLLDVGGGEGVFVRHVRAANPRLHVALFDLPAVAARSSDVERHGGDFFADALPPGFDLISTVRILHDHDDAPVMKLLRNIHAALAPGGRLLIAEPMAGTAGAERMGDAYFGMYLWAMGSGRPRTAHETKDMLRDAGFVRIREIPTHLPLITRLLIAERDKA